MKSGITRFFLFIIVLSFFNLNTNATELDPRNFNYSKVDSISLKIGKFQFNSIESLSGYINKTFSTEHERVRSIFIWITNNIEYNYSAKFADEENVFRTKKAVCNGYSILFKKLCENSKIKSRLVYGWAKSSIAELDSSTESNHAWNIVTFYDVEYLIDATWAAGGLDVNSKKFYKKYNGKFFLCPPEIFIVTHYPENPEDQLLNEIISFNEYSSSPVLKNNVDDKRILTNDVVTERILSYYPKDLNIKTKYRFGNEFSVSTNDQIKDISVKITFAKGNFEQIESVSYTKKSNIYYFMYPFEIFGEYFATICLDGQEVITYKVIVE